MNSAPTHHKQNFFILIFWGLSLLLFPVPSPAGCNIEDEGRKVPVSLLEMGKGVFIGQGKKVGLVTCATRITMEGVGVHSLKPGGCFFTKEGKEPLVLECSDKPPAQPAPCQVEWGDETIYPETLDPGTAQAISIPHYPLLIACQRPHLSAPGFRIIQLKPGSCQAVLVGTQVGLFECKMPPPIPST